MEDETIRSDIFWYLINPMISEALSRINVVITHLNALEPENAEAYDNAVSALGKICQFHRENIDSAQVCPSQIPKGYMFMHSYDLMVIYTWVGIPICKVYI